MKIHVNEIPVEGLEINQSYDSCSLDLETEEVRFLSPLRFSGGITKQKNNLRIEGKIMADIEFVCSRCLTNFKKEISKKIEFDYFLRGERFLDITNDICQEIILEYPLKPLCQPECKGLCMICGQNLNERKCECQSSCKS